MQRKKEEEKEEEEEEEKENSLTGESGEKEKYVVVKNEAGSLKKIRIKPM